MLPRPRAAPLGVGASRVSPAVRLSRGQRSSERVSRQGVPLRWRSRRRRRLERVSLHALAFLQPFTLGWDCEPALGRREGREAEASRC